MPFSLRLQKEVLFKSFLKLTTPLASKVLFGSKNVTQTVMVMVYARLLAVTNLNRLVSNFSVVSDYGWTKTNMI
jgi:hypothetical protein